MSRAIFLFVQFWTRLSSRKGAWHVSSCDRLNYGRALARRWQSNSYHNDGRRSLGELRAARCLCRCFHNHESAQEDAFSTFFKRVHLKEGHLKNTVHVLNNSERVFGKISSLLRNVRRNMLL